MWLEPSGSSGLEGVRRSRQISRPTRIKRYAATRAAIIVKTVRAPESGEEESSPIISRSDPTAISAADTTEVPSRNKKLRQPRRILQGLVRLEGRRHCPRLSAKMTQQLTLENHPHSSHTLVPGFYSRKRTRIVESPGLLCKSLEGIPTHCPGPRQLSPRLYEDWI